MSVSEADGAGAPLSISQRGDTASFLGLSLKNSLLNIVTLSLYRFWGKTEIRRRIWSTTLINGEPLEYTGRGMELFLGFLFALLIVGLPFLLIVFGAQLLGPVLAALVTLPAYLGLLFLFGFGVFTAFRYLASRTSWRGVRWRLRGSPGDYGVTYLGYALLSAITLGWFWPAASRRLSGRLWGGLTFGDLHFAFDLDAARRESGAYALGWVIVAAAYVLFVAMMMSVMGAAVQAGDDGAPPVPDTGMFVTVYIAAIVFAVAAAVAFAPYTAAALRSVAAGVKVGDARFTLTVTWLEIVWLSLSNFALVLVSLGFLLPFVQIRTARFVVSRLRPSGNVDLDRVAQTPDTGPRTGEGLADAFGSSVI